MQQPAPRTDSRERDVMRQKLPRHWTDIRRDWTDLAFYERFETIVAFILTLVIAIVVVVALSRLIVGVVEMLFLRAQNPLDHAVFQVVFGEILTLLIALEFNHTLRYTIAGDPGIIQTKVVLLIALLALARKVIVIDLSATNPAAIGALAALTVSLGVTYWFVEEHGRRGRGGRDEKGDSHRHVADA
jgi:uncharacterized membrane protein (DUF373 family)